MILVLLNDFNQKEQDWIIAPYITSKYRLTIGSFYCTKQTVQLINPGSGDKSNCVGKIFSSTVELLLEYWYNRLIAHAGVAKW
jgi:hypothetical protein